MLLKLINGTAQGESGQWLENVDQTQLVLASGMLVQKAFFAFLKMELLNHSFAVGFKPMTLISE